MDIQPDGSHQSENTRLLYHEGLFWRCSYQKSSDGKQESMLSFWISKSTISVVIYDKTL